MSHSIWNSDISEEIKKNSVKLKYRKFWLRSEKPYCSNAQFKMSSFYVLCTISSNFPQSHTWHSRKPSRFVDQNPNKRKGRTEMSGAPKRLKPTNGFGFRARVRFSRSSFRRSAQNWTNTCPVMVKRKTRSSLSGHFALYALCDHSLWTPAVIPKPEVYTVAIAGRKHKTRH